MAVSEVAVSETSQAREPVSTKEQIELELLRAQLTQITRANEPTLFARTKELITIVGSIVLGIGGLSAAITGYQLNELKSERLQSTIEQDQRKSAALKTQIEDQVALLRAVERSYLEESQGLSALALRASEVRPGNPTTEQTQRDREIEFEKIKNQMQKLSQQQQALSNIIDALDDLSKSAIRSIKAS